MFHRNTAISFRLGTVASKRHVRFLAKNSGFTLLETLVAIVIFSIALMAVSSISIGMVGSNKLSKHYLEASVLAQSQIEILRNTGFGLGPDGVLGTSDDVIPQILSNPTSANDLFRDPATMFANPDHAYTVVNGVETTPVLDTPQITISQIPRRTWIVRDNIPVSGMKTITVVVGWKEGMSSSYSVVSTTIQGQ